MSEFSITIEAGKSKRLLTAGKYCDRDIVVTAEGGGSGGLPEGVSALASGTITPASDVTTPYTVRHGLGVVPNFALLILCDSTEQAIAGTVVWHVFVQKNINDGSGWLGTNVWAYEGYTATSSYNSSGGMNAEGYGAATSDNFTIQVSSTRPYSYLKAGCTYRWICGVMDGVL